MRTYLVGGYNTDYSCRRWLVPRMGKPTIRCVMLDSIRRFTTARNANVPGLDLPHPLVCRTRFSVQTHLKTPTFYTHIINSP